MRPSHSASLALYYLIVSESATLELDLDFFTFLVFIPTIGSDLLGVLQSSLLREGTGSSGVHNKLYPCSLPQGPPLIWLRTATMESSSWSDGAKPDPDLWQSLSAYTHTTLLEGSLSSESKTVFYFVLEI